MNTKLTTEKFFPTKYFKSAVTAVCLLSAIAVLSLGAVGSTDAAGYRTANVTGNETCPFPPGAPAVQNGDKGGDNGQYASPGPAAPALGGGRVQPAVYVELLIPSAGAAKLKIVI